jgi:predicted alpha/beta-fold hydrolase
LIPDFQPLLRNPHALTVLANYWPRKIDLARFPSKRVEYRIDSSTRIITFEHQPEGPSRGSILFAHGLEGSADAGYIQSFAQTALLRGFTVHRMNLRTCGGTEELCETMYHSGLTSDTREISERIRSRTKSPLFLVGFSLGGNLALKLAGEIGHSDLLSGVCAVSPPIDLATCVRTLERPLNRLYAQRFLQRLCSRVRRKSKLAPHLYSKQYLRDIKTVWEFDDRVTAPLFGFGTAANYYATQSAAGYLDAIRTPTLIIAAKDDPLVPFEIYSHPAFRTNPALTLIATEHGGHLGFLLRKKPRFWLDKAALNWIECLLGAGKTKGTMAAQVAYQ